MKKAIIISSILFLLFSCGTTGINNQVKITEKGGDDARALSGVPLRIIPRVKMKNSQFTREKNLFAVYEVSQLCETIAAKKYEKVQAVEMSSLKKTEADRLASAMAEYMPTYPENNQLIVDEIIKADYNNNGFDDILVRYSVSYREPVVNADGENNDFIFHNYRYFSVLKRGRLVDLPKGAISDFYYQPENNSSQMFILVEGRYYLATVNREGRIIRVDEIRTVKNDINNHLLCEFGGQK